MSMILTRAPAHEPVSLEDAKLELGLSGCREDTLLSCLLLAARMVAEHRTGLMLIDQEWSFFLDRWPASGIIQAPVAPLRSVNAVRVHDWHDGVTALDAGRFELDAGRYPSCIQFAKDEVPGPRRVNDSIEIAVSAGLSTSAQDVPEEIRQAILQLAAGWFESREPVGFGNRDIAIAEPIARLLEPYSHATVH
ncbi:MAG: head-tail connector protein [Hyphomicrobiales bacterium]